MMTRMMKYSDDVDDQLPPDDDDELPTDDEEDDYGEVLNVP